MDALESLPEILSNTTEALAIYYTSESMPRRTSDFYVSIICALEGILAWFKHRAAGKAFRALFKQTDYNQALLGSMETIKARVRQLNETAMRCTMQVVRYVDEGVARARKDTSDGFNRVNLDNNAVLSQLSDIREKVEAIAREQVALAAKHANVLTKAQASFEDQMLDARASASPHQNHQKPPKKAPVDVGSILAQLGYDSHTSEKDLASCLRLGRTLTLTEENRVATIIKHPRLAAWLISPEPDILLVNSNGENKRWSPMSYVSAQLISSFGKCDGSIIPLYFFCGEHINWRRDDNAYPPSLISTLIGQLLSHWWSSPEELPPMQNLRNKPKPASTVELWSLFKRLIRQIPETYIVLCIIDGISYFEDDERREDACSIVKGLNSLVQRGRGPSPLLKVLLTSPSICRHIRRYLEKSDIINIPAVCPAQGGFRQRELDMQFRCLTQLTEVELATLPE
ncbi:hypothetical protein BJY04DRAFT_225177 [Aspergillus karnatakaensis]|uniref:uncharacterized protein n=1 Tax=Aspergillus karnatakaensis TaxID=1810916 RepID=UPI003CCC9B65